MPSKIILIYGRGNSGKITFSILLQNYYEQKGYNCKSIRLDIYVHNIIRNSKQANKIRVKVGNLSSCLNKLYKQYE